MDLGFAVMDGAGIDQKHAAGRDGWTAINCASKRAYGCGDIGNSAVQHLDLLLHHHGGLENLSSSLSVRAGDEVFRWIDKVIADDNGGSRIPADRDLRSKVEVVDKGLIVVTLSFSMYDYFYYLVFDSVDSSLSMIPYVPRWASCYNRSPLPLRRDDDGGYTLVLLGGEFGIGRDRENKFLWHWSPSLSEGSSDSEPWRTNKLRLPTEMEGHFFCPDVLFSSNGFAFWTDLALGTLCCDRTSLLAPDANFTFIDLPPGYRIDRDTLSVEVYRTMGHVGGSLKFVSIDQPEDRYGGGGTRIKVWTLGPSRRDWKLCLDFKLKKLFKDRNFKEAGLPKTLPMYPMLREQESATLYFILAQKLKKSNILSQNHYICRFDMPTKSLLQSKLLAHTSLIQGPVILPSDFFEYLDPLPSTLELDPDGRSTKRPRICQKPADMALVANNSSKKSCSISAKSPEKDYEQMKPRSFEKPTSRFSVLIRGFDPTLSVGKLRSSLEEYFSQCGTVTGVSVNASEGKAYVSFVDVNSVNRATELCGSDLGGYNLYVIEANIRGGFGGSGGIFG